MCSHSCRTLRTCVGHVHKVFLLALRRFLARRGNCKVIYSDNARTFKAAERELAYFANILKDSEFQNFVADKGIPWMFIVERAPWWGGFYERLVKREPEPLTPAHFLELGYGDSKYPIHFIELIDATTAKESYKKRKTYRTLLLKQLWRRWKEQYLLQLNTANHFKTPSVHKNLKLNDVVLVEGNVKSKLLWALGIIKEIFIGRDDNNQWGSVFTVCILLCAIQGVLPRSRSQQFEDYIHTDGLKLQSEYENAEINYQPISLWNGTNNAVEPPLFIGSFNIQTLAKKKLKQSHLMSTIERIVHRYDLVLILELMTNDSQLTQRFLEDVNLFAPKGVVYNMTVSSDPHVNEFCAIFYRTDKLRILKTESYYDPDRFYRKPFFVLFDAPTLRDMKRFGMIGYHVKPSQAVREIDALVEVYDFMKKKYSLEMFLEGHLTDGRLQCRLRLCEGKRLGKNRTVDQPDLYVAYRSFCRYNH
ncbi:integrase catalytic domain-containing protein [Trichonephila clavipes]|uniref:Integrase catalytic domain-containing protein n=1 Tax=Trichonephila clavipes TaxID=2585209 RepID=A0A8X6W1W0_TRICX|nr:integrase catalytic domain-containing protein [Trichonephila clavipes]